MIYCIDPDCQDRCNRDEENFCHSCGTDLIINERYRLIKPLRELGQGHDTEVFEVDNLGSTKVLKVLTSSRPRLVNLFEQEAKIPKSLAHLDVPQVDTSFTFSLPTSGKKLRCLVMEKVPGENLEQWLKQNKVLSEARAIDWLSQLSKFITQLHKEQILHRDIKPSNIILRPDGKLILIDFGTARRITITYTEKLLKEDVTRIISTGYTAPEQHQGKAENKSDFYALGCTFVYLLTGIHPNDLPKDERDRLIWRDRASNISQRLADLIDGLIAPLPSERLQTPQLLDSLQSDRELPANPPTPLSETKTVKGQTSRIWRNLGQVVGVSIAIAFAIMGIRYLGLLQNLELKAYDRLMVSRPVEEKASRLLLITIDEADIAYQNEMGMLIRWSLSDEALFKLFQKLKPYKPRTIGIDLYRDFAVDSDYSELADYFRNDDRLFAPCKIPAPEDGAPDGIAPPPNIPTSHLGFSDLIVDNRDEVVRRHLLYLNPPPTSVCTADSAFNLKIAQHFLAQQDIELNITDDEQIQIGEVKFKSLENHSSGYQNIDASGYQILFNYLAVDSPSDIAEQISLRDVLEDRIAPEIIESLQDRIVLIGVTADSLIDVWETPYFRYPQIHGIFVQAQAIFQIVSAVLDRRPLIWWWSAKVEMIWVLLWALLGGIFAWLIRSPWYLAAAIAGANFLLSIICFVAMVNAGWIPLIPPALALIMTPLVVIWLLRVRRSLGDIVKN